MATEFSRVEIMSGIDKVANFTDKLAKASYVKQLIKKGVTGITVYNNVIGCGIQYGLTEIEYELSPEKLAIQLRPKSVVTFVCESSKVEELVEFLKIELYTGHIGDGKIFVSDVRNIIRVRTGEEGMDALNASTID